MCNNQVDPPNDRRQAVASGPGFLASLALGALVLRTAVEIQKPVPGSRNCSKHRSALELGQ